MRIRGSVRVCIQAHESSVEPPSTRTISRFVWVWSRADWTVTGRYGMPLNTGTTMDASSVMRAVCHLATALLD